MNEWSKARWRLRDAVSRRKIADGKAERAQIEYEQALAAVRELEEQRKVLLVREPSARDEPAPTVEELSSPSFRPEKWEE